MENTEEGQLSIDELIRIFNGAKNRQNHAMSKEVNHCSFDGGNKLLPPIQTNRKLINYSLRANKTVAEVEKKSIIQQKTLVFKPWSGQCNRLIGVFDTNDISIPIKQQIEQSNSSCESNQSQQEDWVEEGTDIEPIIRNTNQINYLYKFQHARVKLIKYLLDQNGFKESTNNRNWTIYWSSSIIKNEIFRNLMPYQKINHFPSSFHLTRKDLMNKSISKMQEKFGVSHFNFLPKTYILPQEMDQLLGQIHKCPQTYIIKPHNRSQGRGITVTSSLDVIENKLEKYSSLVVSHYIDNPLLINRLKFDLRIYVAVTSLNPLRIYVYEEGLARFATEEYDESCLNTENKKYQHLTNYSINKKNAEYVTSSAQNQEYYGSKWRLTALKDFLAFNIGRHETKELFDRVDDVLIKTIISGENTLFSAFNNSVPYANGCFEVYGFDIMIDSNLKPWLIEVNMSPSLNTDSPLDLKIKGSMVSDLLTMVGIVPLGERYLDGGHTKFEIRHYLKSDHARIEHAGAVEKFVLKEVELENQRSGDWRRVFPSITSARYKNYFDKDRYFNRLLREGLQNVDIKEYSSMKSESLKEAVRSYSSNKPNSNKSISSAAVRITTNNRKPVQRFKSSKRRILY